MMTLPRILKLDAGPVANTVLIGFIVPAVVLWAMLGSTYVEDTALRNICFRFVRAGIFLPSLICSDFGEIFVFSIQGFILGGAIDLLRWYRRARAH